MIVRSGDLGGGVKAPGSGDAGTAGQAQAGQPSQGLFAPGHEPNSRSGAVTTLTLAIQVAAQIGGYSRYSHWSADYALRPTAPAWMWASSRQRSRGVSRR